MTETKVITELDGEVTELTEEEIIILLEYRMSNDEEQEEIRNLIEKAMSE